LRANETFGFINGRVKGYADNVVVVGSGGGAAPLFDRAPRGDGQQHHARDAEHHAE
jgi:hypothetical protein